MKVKTFTGATINEALSAIKEEMGDSVLILETRPVDCDGLNRLLGKRLVEVIVAADDMGQASADPGAVLGIPGGNSEEEENLLGQESPAPDEPAALPEPVIRTPEELMRRHERNRGKSVSRPVFPPLTPMESSDDGRQRCLRSQGNIPPQNAPVFSPAAAPVQNAAPPVQLPLVLQRIQELNAQPNLQPNGVAAPNLVFPFGQPVNPASGYQIPQFAHLSPQNGEFPASGQRTALTYPPVPGQGGADPAWQRGPQNFSVEETPRAAPPAPAAQSRATKPRLPENLPEARFEPSEDTIGFEALPYPDSYQATFRRLLDQDMPEPMAKSLVEHALRSQGPDAAPDRIENALRTALLAVVRTAPVADRENPKLAKSGSPESVSNDRDPWQILEEELAGEGTAARSAPNGPTLVAFVGTAGVGKTASLAKLAAHFANRKLRSVGLIGIETPHLGSVDQLQACGELLGTPVRRVRSPVQLAEAVKEMQDRAYILIDTPPCSLRPVERKSARSPFQPKHLKPFLEAVPGIQTQLVLSATTRARDIRTTIKTFGQIPVNALVFTKLDETHALGHLLGLLQETNLPVSYLTAGREIPDDLETATPEGLIERVLGGREA